MIRQVATTQIATETMPNNHSIELLQDALLPLVENKARRKCLAGAIVALLTVQSLNLRKLANLFPTEAKADSAYKRLQRLLRYFEIDLNRLAILLSRWCGVAPPWNLSMDRTNWKLGASHLNLFVLCIVTRAISFPLLWIGLSKEGKGKAGNTHTEERITLMKRFLTLFGSSACACLRADREFASGDFLLFLEEHGVGYQLRLKATTLIANGRGERCCADYLFRGCAPQEERVLGYRRVLGKVRFVTGTRLVSGDFLILVSDVARPLKMLRDL